MAVETNFCFALHEEKTIVLVDFTWALKYCRGTSSSAAGRAGPGTLSNWTFFVSFWALCPKKYCNWSWGEDIFVEFSIQWSAYSSAQPHKRRGRKVWETTIFSFINSLREIWLMNLCYLISSSGTGIAELIFFSFCVRWICWNRVIIWRKFLQPCKINKIAVPVATWTGFL